MPSQPTQRPSVSDSPSADAEDSNEPLRLVLGGAALVVMVGVAYLPALGAGFIWDDDAFVTANETLRGVAGLRRIWTEPSANLQYYPMVFTGLWIQHAIWGIAPLGYHVVSLILHALNAGLLWRVLKALGLPGAWLAGAFFALHPIEVESVAWISEQKNLLSGFFYLSSLLAYWRFSQAGGSISQRRGRYAAALLLFLCALLSKTVTCSLPAVLLLVLWWKHGRIRRHEVLALLPFFGIGLALALNTVRMEIGDVGAVGSGWDHSFAMRCLIAGRVLLFYVGKLLWPHPLAFIYERWEIDAGEAWQYAFPAAVLILVALLFTLRHRIGRAPICAALIFAGTLTPALGFIPVYPMRYSFVADHFQYLAGCALIALAVCGGAAALRDVSPSIRRAAIVAAAALLSAYAWLVFEQAKVYQDLESLWSDTVAKTPGSGMAHNSLAHVYLDRGRDALALEHFSAAVEHAPHRSGYRSNLAMQLEGAGRRSEAIAQYRAILTLVPDDARYTGNAGQARLSLGRLYLEAGDASESARVLEALLSSDAPSLRGPRIRARAHATLGSARRKLGDTRGARRAFDRASHIAWRLAGTDGLGDLPAQEALRVALAVCEQTGYRDRRYVAVLAEAHAARGQWKPAIRAALKSRALARAAGHEEAVSEASARLERYRSHRRAGGRSPILIGVDKEKSP